MLTMKDFEYVDGNRFEFDGAFGHVELIYYADRKEEQLTGEIEVIPSHFDAFLTPAGKEKPQTISSGTTTDTAVQNLYAKYAEYRALEDLGRI